MAKVLRLSDDDGATYSTLPGSTAGFNSDAESQDDTVFGQTFRSQEVGMITWNMDGNAYFKGFAGYKAKIMQADVSTAMVDEAMEQETGQIYKVTAAAKDLLDRSVAITIEDAAVDVTDQVEWIDYLFGRIKFLDGYIVNGAVTITGNYFTRNQLGKSNSYTLTMQAETKDESDYETAQANGGFRTYAPGLRTIEFETGGIFDAALGMLSELAGRGEVVVEFDAAGDGLSVARGFFKLNSVSQTGDVGAVEEEGLSGTLTVPDDEDMYTPFGWRHAATSTLNAAVKKALTAFIDETTLKAQYLPSGATGQAPLDGKEGEVIVTDISLSGALDAMNTFELTLTGTGAVTTV